VRQAVEALIVVGGGVISDRLPRSLVLAGASTIQAIAQAATAALVLTGSGSVTSLALLQALYGIGGGLVIPAEVGLVPETVSPDRLQQANAVQGLSRNVVGVLGPAVGGALVVASSPGIALAVDAATFTVCAVLLSRIRVPRRPSRERAYLRELREGWHEFRGRTWLWTTVALFGLSNMMWVGCWAVLGPSVAESELGGARAWATILTAGGAGAVVGGLFALRYRPRRPLVAAILAAAPMTLQLVGLAFAWPVWLIAALTFVGSIGLSVHLTLWFTVFQREIPEHVRSRVSSYDTLGSFVLVPVGMAIAGPAAAAVGVDAWLWAAFATFLGVTVVMLAIPSVWAIRGPGRGRAG
jgi:MFS family permease